MFFLTKSLNSGKNRSRLSWTCTSPAQLSQQDETLLSFSPLRAYLFHRGALLSSSLGSSKTTELFQLWQSYDLTTGPSSKNLAPPSPTNVTRQQKTPTQHPKYERRTILLAQSRERETKMQGLMNGSECSTAASPLASLLKHQNQDQSLHAQSNHSTTSQHHSIRSRSTINQQTNQEADRFFQQQEQPLGGGGAFGMDQMRRDLLQTGPIKGDRGEPDQFFHPRRDYLIHSLESPTPQNGPRNTRPQERDSTQSRWPTWKNSFVKPATQTSPASFSVLLSP